MNNSHKYLTKNEALSKLQGYCAYQDRCHQEVRSKLLSLKIYGDDLEEIIGDLIKENFLNEERFARSYARGKFRIKKWGRRRIITELKRRKISEYLVKKALTEIEEEEYLETAYYLTEKYYATQTSFEAMRRKKTYEHMIRKGYESHIVNPILNELRTQYNDGKDSAR